VIGDLLLGEDFLEQCNVSLKCSGITARIKKNKVIGDLLLGVDFLEQCNVSLKCRGITARIKKNKRNHRITTGNLTEIQEISKPTQGSQSRCQPLNLYEARPPN